ncbi:hypothetical protein [Wohlfahrtiimonas sp. G9077]|uniref:hypothetical protein n=1 Tax=Wohlfahrtiimonas sp. G9077 TaxID=1980118 RepID=UPI000BC656E3|nr:hypothetical protein [Wohlfahrtiimonas sp. G9077]OYQ73917.1 hypothetical protein B9T20_06020 [Wohlfahrtiimonas sp. G9077]
MHAEKLKLDGKGWINHLQEVITVHGFRSTFRDWAAETTDYSNMVAEMALVHKIKNNANPQYQSIINPLILGIFSLLITRQ